MYIELKVGIYLLNFISVKMILDVAILVVAILSFFKDNKINSSTK